MTGVMFVPEPGGWEAWDAPGVRVKPLPTAPGGDAFSALRLGPGAVTTSAAAPDVRYLLLDGQVDLGDPSIRAHRGDWFGLAVDGPTTMTTGTGAFLLRVAGPRLGDPATDLFGPDGWQALGPGQWFRLLNDVTFGPDFDERVVGVALLEPGASSPRHPHATAHRFYLVDGTMDDEVIHPDGHRETARRRAGDFIDYPFPVEHRSVSRDGALNLFVHEPVGAS